MAGTHEIESYRVKRYATTLITNFSGFVYHYLGFIECTNEATRDAMVLYIVPDDKTPTRETVELASGDHVGFMGIRRDEVDFFIDLLRNEKPMYMTINAGGAFNSIQTGKEPVGEGLEPTEE